MQKNSNCRFCGDRDKTVDHIESKCCKLTQKEYKSKHDWSGKVIQWELRKRLKFVYADKWYIHKPESFLEKETHKIL